MNMQDFDSAGALKDFVVDQSITQDKIVTITHVHGRWYLFWYA